MKFPVSVVDSCLSSVACVSTHCRHLTSLLNNGWESLIYFMYIVAALGQFLFIYLLDLYAIHPTIPGFWVAYNTIKV